MIKLFNAENMRAADRYTIETLGISSEELMRRAGVAIAEEVAAAADRHSRITVVCGTGNNGGDGYVCARELLSRGYNVSVYALGGRLSDDCLREKNKFSGTYASTIGGEIVVDCIFGTGLSRRVEGDFAAAVSAINNSGAFVVSADIPSGLSSDSGQALGAAVRADVTVAIGAPKLGFALGSGPDLCGRIVVKDIGICTQHSPYAAVWEDADVAALFPARPRNSHKGTFGRASLRCGSALYPGAALLAVSAALKSGCGYVCEACADERLKFAVASRCPQAIFSENADLSSDCIAVGMGCGASRGLYGEICALLKDYCGTLIIDADGLNVLSAYGKEALKSKKCTAIITPHAKEFARLTGADTEEILADPVGSAVRFAREYGVITLLKGAGTVITDGREVIINTRGCTAQAKAGSGDMLAGFMCGTIARGLEPLAGAACAAYVMGAAASLAAEELTDYCVTAADVLENIPRAVKNIAACGE